MVLSHPRRSGALRRVLPLLAVLTLAACATAPPRTAPLPERLADKATVLGLSDAREWGDELPPTMEQLEQATPEQIGAEFSGIMRREHHYLALSGGGENGAFAAGLLAGWTAAGNRPEFTIVTGVSTGALIAPFAFLGSAYDDAIREVYTSHAMEDLVYRRALYNVIRNDAVADSTPMQAVIEQYLTPEVVGRIAREYRKGRQLLIGTTHLDAGRPMLWNIGRIAASGAAGSVELIRSIMLASASIPLAVPPVMIEVEAEGQRYDEMHVDGGVTEQVFLYPVQLNWQKVLQRLYVKGAPRVYVVRNGYLEPRWESMERKLVPLGGRTISSLIRTQGIGDLYRMYITTHRDGLDYNLAYIPESFAASLPERSGLDYMRQLYEFAYEQARAGYPWDKAPPGLRSRGLAAGAQGRPAAAAAR